MFRTASLFIVLLTALGPGAGAAGAAAKDRISGTVIETMDAGGYTYAQVDTGSGKLWLAGPRTALKKGDKVEAINPSPMPGFRSKTLKRRFEMLYFVGSFGPDAVRASPSPHGDMGKSAGAPPSPHGALGKPAGAPVAGIARAENGLTIAEIRGQKQKLAGKTVRLRGKVVKFTPKILGRNWLHLRDSSTAADLTVTTTGTVKPGDVVLAQGRLALDKDFGMGYVYDLLLEDATVTPE